MSVSAPWMLAALLALSGSFASAAQAEDFTIIVPVEVTNLPDDARPEVHCHVIAGNASKMGGIGEAPLPSGRDFSGKITVRFDLFESGEVTLAEVTGYSCSLMLHPDAEHVALSWDRCVEVGRDPASNPLICGARGAPAMTLVEGSF